MTVAHIDVAIRGHGSVCGPAEWSSTHRWRRAERAPDREDVATVLRPLPDRLVAAVSGIDVTVDPDRDAVREREVMLAVDLAPRVEEVPIAVEDHHRMLPAVEHVDVVIRVDGDIRDLDERPPLGTLEEPLHDLVAVPPYLPYHPCPPPIHARAARPNDATSGRSSDGKPRGRVARRQRDYRCVNAGTIDSTTVGPSTPNLVYGRGGTSTS